MLKIVNTIDAQLSKITMYRVVLYYVAALLVVAVGLGALKLIPYQPTAIIFSVLFITTICVVANMLFAKVFKAFANAESVYITAFILALIISPPSAFLDSHYFMIAIWASVWAMASKFMFAIYKKHIFNPVAIGVVMSGLVGLTATWWVATFWMMPLVLVGGLLVTRKIQRFDLVVSFLVFALGTILASRFLYSSVTPDIGSVVTILQKSLIDAPAFFFAFAMLTEPLTTPPKRSLRILYGAFVGIIFAPAMHLWGVYSTPEIALVIGNIFSYLVGPKGKFFLTLKEKTLIAADTYNFAFAMDGARMLHFKPGQYLEWTVPSDAKGIDGKTLAGDSRGNRRYFTIASSPTERVISLGAKFYAPPSTFKKVLLAMKPGENILAGQLAGEFTLPKDVHQKLVFIAGGIGITPFTSMVTYLCDIKEKRDAVLLYTNRTEADIAYKEIFDRGAAEIGLRTIYALTDTATISPSWTGERGYITADMIRVKVPDYAEREFYLSGPHSMVVAFEKTLLDMGVKRRMIKKDFFPGFA